MDVGRASGCSDADQIAPAVPDAKRRSGCAGQFQRPPEAIWRRAMKTNDRTVARRTGRWSVLFLAGAAALAGLGAAPSTASADRYERDRDRDSSRFRDGRVDVRVGEQRDYRVE